MADLQQKPQQPSSLPSWLAPDAVSSLTTSAPLMVVKGLFDAAAARKKRQMEIMQQGAQGQSDALDKGVQGGNDALARLMSRF
jgi:hypothetical protein